MKPVAFLLLFSLAGCATASSAPVCESWGGRGKGRAGFLPPLQGSDMRDRLRLARLGRYRSVDVLEENQARAGPSPLTPAPWRGQGGSGVTHQFTSTDNTTRRPTLLNRFAGEWLLRRAERQ